MTRSASGPGTVAEPRSRLLAAFAAVYIVWGSTYLAIRYSVETIPPFLMASSRFIVSGAALYAWARFRGAQRPTRGEWGHAAIAGLLMLCGGNGAVSWAEQRVPSGIAALIVGVVPLWMVVVDWARPGGVRPTPRVVSGLVLALAGVALLIGPRALLGGETVNVIGAVVLIAGSFSWALGSIYNRHGSRPSSAVMATAIQMLGGGAALAILAALSGEIGRFHIADVSKVSALGWGFLVVFGSFVGFTAYIYLLRATTPAKAATYAYVNPVVAVFLGWAIASEAVTGRTLGAAAVILGGVAMISLERRAVSDDET
jgi:drug/metabolite transporter (DMT)-like permease